MSTSSETPIFYDARGRRGLVMRVLGGVSGTASAGGLALIVTGVLGFGAVPSMRPQAAPTAQAAPPARTAVPAYRLAAPAVTRRRSVAIHLRGADVGAHLRAARLEQATDRRLHTTPA